MSNLEPVITIQLGNHPLPIYRLPDGHPGVANALGCDPWVLSLEQGILQWLYMAQVDNLNCIKFFKECLEDALDYSQAQDILNRALVKNEGAIGEVKDYLLKAIYKKINEHDWLEALEDLQEDIREKDWQGREKNSGIEFLI